MFDGTMGAAGAAGSWVVNNTTTPGHQAIDATVAVSKWNWKKGWDEDSPETSRIEPLNGKKTFNNQHSTSNIQGSLFGTALEVGR